MAKPSKKYDLKSERSWANRPKNLTCVKSSRGQNCVFYKFLQNYEFQIVSGCPPGGIPGGLSQFSFTGFTCLRSMSWFLKKQWLQWLQWLQDIAGDCIWSRQFPESWRCLRVLGWICIYLIFLNPKYPFTLSPSPFFWRWRESMKFCLQPNMSQLLGCERLKDTGMLWSDWV